MQFFIMIARDSLEVDNAVDLQIRDSVHLAPPNDSREY